MEPGIEATACACELLYVCVYILDSRTVEKQNDRLRATDIKYSSELKFAYGRVRVKIVKNRKIGRPYA